MYRLLAILLSSWAFAQTAPEADIAAAAKSPLTLARYIESHKSLDWEAVWKAIGRKDPDVLAPPCNPCSTSILTVLNPDQAILIIQSGGRKTNDIYLRYMQEANGDWRFAGERRAFIYESPRRYEVIRVGTKPFLKISSDFSQIGVGITQELEDWLDLTQPDFDPVFSATVNGGQNLFSMGVSRTIHAQPIVSQSSGLERIDLILNVQFIGPGLALPVRYTGVYDRPANQKKFELRTACLGFCPGTAIPSKEFEELADPFAIISNEQLLVYALPGLQKIATGSDSEAKEWLRSILEKAKDTPEKRTLLRLLRRP